MIIGLCGFKGSGKDTFANILINYGFVKLSFAGILKDIVSIIFDWDRELLEGSTPESRIWREEVDPWWSKRLNIPNLTPRYILQYFGTDLFREYFHDEIWIAIIEKKLNKYPNIVITDCRFPNEIEMLKKYNAIFIQILRDIPVWYEDYKNNIIDKPIDIHPSEYLWIKSNFNYTYYNNKNISNMEEFIKSNLL